VTEGWESKPFVECLERVTYTPKIQRKDFLRQGPYPIVSQEDQFINGYWDRGADLFRLTKPVVVFGDHTKVLKYIDFDFVLGADGVKILQPLDFLEPKFLFYRLQMANLDSLGYARHYRLLKELDVAYPPRPEQQRIVGILDEAFEGIAAAKANAEKNLKNARTIFESHLRAVLAQRGEGWVEESLEGLVASGVVQLTRGKVISKRDLAATPGEFPVYSSAKEKNGQFGKYGLFMFDEELITWSVDGGGRLFHRPRHKFSVTNVGGILRILQPDRLSYEYLYRVLSYLHSQVRFDWVRKAHPSVILKLYNDIPVPSLDTQVRVSESLRDVERPVQRLEAIYERKLAACQELKMSLLHEAFAGRLGTQAA